MFKEDHSQKKILKEVLKVKTEMSVGMYIQVLGCMLRLLAILSTYSTTSMWLCYLHRVIVLLMAPILKPLYFPCGKFYVCL